MHWIGISGSRMTDERVVADVAGDVAELMARGDGLIAGGAVGVDFHATQEALALNPEADRIQVIIPAALPIYQGYFERQLRRGPSRAGAVTPDTVSVLFNQLRRLRTHGALVEMHQAQVNAASFLARNRAIVERADALLAYCVNRSSGTMYTVGRAKAASIPVTVRHYTL